MLRVAADGVLDAGCGEVRMVGLPFNTLR